MAAEKSAMTVVEARIHSVSEAANKAQSRLFELESKATSLEGQVG